MKFTITLTATVYAYTDINIDVDSVDAEDLRAADIKDSRDVKFYLGAEAADDARMQIERAKEQLRRKLRLLNDTPSEVFCEYEIVGAPTFDLQRFAGGRKWSVRTHIKRAIKRYLRSMGVHERLNEWAAEKMCVYRDHVLAMRACPQPYAYEWHFEKAKHIDGIFTHLAHDHNNHANFKILAEAFSIFSASI